MSLARRVRDLRRAKGWGPQELAARAGITPLTLARIERGRVDKPRVATLRRLARALGVAPAALIEAAAAGEVARDPELERKFRELLASPLGGALARIIEESYRLLRSHADDH